MLTKVVETALGTLFDDIICDQSTQCYYIYLLFVSFFDQINVGDVLSPLNGCPNPFFCLNPEQLLDAFVCIDLSYLLARLKTIHDWHVQVQYYQIEGFTLGLCVFLDRFQTKGVIK